MKIITRILLACFLTVTLGACGDDGKPTPFECTLTYNAVVYADAALHAEITALVTDKNGKALKGEVIALVSNRDGDVIEPLRATTDEAGQAVFDVTTTRGGIGVFQVQLVPEGEDLGSPLAVEFELDLELSAGEVDLTHPGGRVSLTGSVADGLGPVEGARLAVSSSRGAADTIDPASAATGAAGTVEFTVTTQESGMATFTLEVDGLDLTELGKANVFFDGPTLTGEWGFPQPGGVISSPRIGLVWIDYASFQTGVLEHRELISVALEPVPELGDQGSYSLPLPLHAPQADLFDPAPEDTTLPDTFVIAPYALVVYDDLDASEDFSTDDPVVAMSDEELLLVYVEGDLPDPGRIPNITRGYQFMEMGEGEEGEVPTIVPLADLIDQNDLYIRSAPCPSGPVAGQVSFGNQLPPGSDTRVAVLLVDANLIFSGREDEIFDAGNYLELASADVAFAPGTSVNYELTLPDPADVDAGYASFLVSQFPEFPAFGVLSPLVYIDSDGDDAFTNDDDNWQTYDVLVGAWDLPFGYGSGMMEWIDGPVSLLYSIMIPGVNPGYNIIREPLEMDVQTVVDDNTLRLVEEVPAGHTGLCFRIMRDTTGEEILVLQGDDLATGGAPGFAVTSATGGFSAVQPGDRLVFCNQIDQVQLLDLDTPYNLKTHE